MFTERFLAPSFTPIAVLRGEIGSSMMKTRIINGRLMYLRGIFGGNNALLRELIRKPRCKLLIKVEQYLRLLKTTKEEVLQRSECWLKGRVNEWDTMEWEQNINSKSSLHIYRRWKTEVKEEEYFNDTASSFLFKLRSNTVNLNDRNRHQGGNTECTLCGENNEDLVHFVVDCVVLQSERNKILKLQRPQEENREKLVGEVLFKGRGNEQALYRMFLLRKAEMTSKLS